MLGKMLPLQEEYVRKWREMAEETSWLRTKDEPNNLSLSWHAHCSLLALSSALWELTAPLSANGRCRSVAAMWLRGGLTGVFSDAGSSFPGATWTFCSGPGRPSSTASPSHPWPLLRFPRLLQPVLQPLGHLASCTCCTCHHHLLCTTAAHLHCSTLSDHLFLSDTPLWNAVTPNQFLMQSAETWQGTAVFSWVQFASKPTGNAQWWLYMIKILFTLPAWSSKSFVLQWVCYKLLSPNQKREYFKPIDINDSMAMQTPSLREGKVLCHGLFASLWSLPVSFQASTTVHRISLLLLLTIMLNHLKLKKLNM